MADLRAGLVGVGQMGRHHARVLGALPGVELVGATDPAVVANATPPGVEVHGSMDQLIRRGLDIAVLATPTSTHEALGVRLAEAGVHTLIEKPVAPDVAAGAALNTAFDRAGVLGCVGHIERYNPALRDMRRRLAGGELGEIYQVATRRIGPFPARIGDIGVILDLATHDIDSTSWATGRQYRTVSAQTAHRSGRNHEDLVAAVAALDGGVVATHLVNWLSPLKERLTVVIGERGALVADTVTADLTFYANGVAPVAWDAMQPFRGVVEGDVIRYALAKAEPLRLELEAFRDAVLGLRHEVVTLREATAVVGVAEAMRRSAETGQTQTLAPLGTDGVRPRA